MGYDASTAQQQMQLEWGLMNDFEQGVQALQNAGSSVKAAGRGATQCLEAVGGILGGGLGGVDPDVGGMLQDWRSVASDGRATSSASNDIAYLHNSAKALYDSWYQYLNAQSYAPQPMPIYYSDEMTAAAQDFIALARSTLASLL